MLLRSSALIYPGLHLITLGNTCRYLVRGDSDTVILSDPGCSAHVAFLSERLARLGLALSDVKMVVLTHCDADRMAGLALLRRLIPHVAVSGPASMVHFLESSDVVRRIWEEDRTLTSMLELDGKVPEVTFDEFREGARIDRPFVDSDVISVDQDTAMRIVSTPGHRQHSAAYLVLPHEFLIVDETFGYYQGRRLAAPGGDLSLASALASIKKFDHMDVSGIGFPYAGSITGELVRKHLEAIVINTGDMVSETQRALSDGTPEVEIRAQVREAFFVSPLRDPCLRQSLERTFEAVWPQIHKTELLTPS